MKQKNAAMPLRCKNKAAAWADGICPSGGFVLVNGPLLADRFRCSMRAHLGAQTGDGLTVQLADPRLG
ncbi:MAG: hypothetical protein AB7U71_24645, partial [Comamonas sp.]